MPSDPSALSLSRRPRIFCTITLMGWVITFVFAFLHVIILTSGFLLLYLFQILREFFSVFDVDPDHHLGEGLCGNQTTVSILLVRKANAKGSVSDFEIAPPSKGGGSDKHLAVN